MPFDLKTTSDLSKRSQTGGCYKHRNLVGCLTERMVRKYKDKSGKYFAFLLNYQETLKPEFNQKS